LSTLFTSGRVVDLILLMLVIEAVVLLTYNFLTGRGIPAVALLINLLAGAFLLTALRSALIQSPWEWTAGWLAAALIAHAADLAQRWRT
jgi:hypothetical protein